MARKTKSVAAPAAEPVKKRRGRPPKDQSSQNGASAQTQEKGQEKAAWPIQRALNPLRRILTDRTRAVKKEQRLIEKLNRELQPAGLGVHRLEG